MIPRADYKKVLLRRVVPLEQLIDLDRAIKIFLVPPTRYIQRRHAHAVQPGCERLPLPERVIVRVIYKVAPCRNLAPENILH